MPAGVRQNGDAIADWESTARTILHCKLVVTVDTAVAHLAGSLGVPTICLLPRRSDWKWGCGEARGTNGMGSLSESSATRIRLPGTWIRIKNYWTPGFRENQVFT